MLTGSAGKATLLRTSFLSWSNTEGMISTETGLWKGPLEASWSHKSPVTGPGCGELCTLVTDSSALKTFVRFLLVPSLCALFPLRKRGQQPHSIAEKEIAVLFQTSGRNPLPWYPGPTLNLLKDGICTYLVKFLLLLGMLS
jgi:hypothetical protein